MPTDHFFLDKAGSICKIYLHEKSLYPLPSPYDCTSITAPTTRFIHIYINICDCTVQLRRMRNANT